MASPFDTIDPNLGRPIADRYELIRRVGRGGYGAVYVGQPIAGDAPVAVKLLKPEVLNQPQVLARFEREARVMQMLDSPHVPRVHASGRLPDGGAFIAMDFIDGATLTRQIRKGALPAERVVHVARAVLTVLVGLHALDPPVYHRDLKPGNVMLRHVDGAVFVLDFGIAKLAYTNEQARTVQTAHGMLPGSIAYSAPERFEGRDDPRSDLYSLGVIMFEALVGRNPFRCDSPLASMRAHAIHPVPDDLTEKQIDPALARLVTRALAKTPAARFESAQAMLDALLLLPIAQPADDGDDTDLTPLPAQQLARLALDDAPTVASKAPPIPAPDWLTDGRPNAPSMPPERVVRETPSMERPVSTPSLLNGLSTASLTPPRRRLPMRWIALGIGILLAGGSLWWALRPAAESTGSTPGRAMSPIITTGPKSVRPATEASARDPYRFVTVSVRPGPARFVQIKSGTVLCEAAQRCQVPIDVDTRVEQAGYRSQVLSGDDLFDRRGHGWKVKLRRR